MFKKIYKYEDVKEEISKAVDIICDPVRQTLGPKGSNVLFEDNNGDQFVTNDGVTIARNISVEDPLQNAIIEVIKQPALRTNNVVGDGTSSTILFSRNLIKASMKLIDEGMNRMVLKESLLEMGEKIKTRLKANVKTIKGKTDMEMIARVSSNGDEVIAKDVVRVVSAAGEDGMVMIEPHNKTTTELVEEIGFNIESDPETLHPFMKDGSFNMMYNNVPVLVTDKMIYYKEEAETILSVAVEAGWDTVVVVARDFVDKAKNYFIANHKSNIIKVLLVKDKCCTERDNTSLEDLATYLGGKLFTDKTGQLVDKVEAKDFIMAKRVITNPVKTIMVGVKKTNSSLKALVKNIKEESDKDPDNKTLKKRLAALTSGTVTIKVGGHTPIETRERMFRYEDSVNATRAAIKDGYLVGGGLALWGSYDEQEHKQGAITGGMDNMAKILCQSSIKQLAENCGKHFETLLENIHAKKGIGYNARTDSFSNLLKDGVIDPYKVTEMAIDNAISITIHLLTSGYIIVNDIESLKDKDNKYE
jgi:chaperonin GroEL